MKCGTSLEPSEKRFLEINGISSKREPWKSPPTTLPDTTPRLLNKTSKSLKWPQSHHFLLRCKLAIIRNQHPLAPHPLKHYTFRYFPAHSFLPEIRNHKNLLLLKNPQVSEDIIILRIKKCKISIYEDIFVAFPKGENFGPICERRIGIVYLSCGVYCFVRRICCLPWCSGGKAAVGGGVPLEVVVRLSLSGKDRSCVEGQ